VFDDVVKDGENEENLDKCEIKGAKIFSSQPWGHRPPLRIKQRLFPFRKTHALTTDTTGGSWFLFEKRR